MTIIKICGIFEEEAAIAVSRLPVDYIGFVFAPSRRRVTPEEAKRLGALVPPGIRKIGVFVNEDRETVIAVTERAALDGVQLHGEECPEDCRSIKASTGKIVFKGWRVRGGEEDRAVAAYEGVVDAILLDAYGDQGYGGTGQRFAWEEIPRLRAIAPQTPFIIAGGLHPGNIEELLRHGGFMGVDVSSGVETDGRKDPDKIRQFVCKVREWDEMAK
jgi:phosphoribosylanthranilate isomerase